MGRSPCCDKNGLKKGPWTPEEDQKLIDYIQKHGHGSWRTLPKNAGLQRCGKSCRLRWTNYLRPDIKRGRFSFEEEETIIQLHSVLGNKWSAIAARLPGRTDNEIKNYWNTHIRKRLLRMGIDPVTHSPRLDLLDLSSVFNSALYNPSHHHHLSRLLGLQHLVNPELLRLATTLLPSSSSQQNTENPDLQFLQNLQENPLCINPQMQQIQLMPSLIEPPLIHQDQIQASCTTTTTTTSTTATTSAPFLNEPDHNQVHHHLMQPNVEQFQSNLSYQNCQPNIWQDNVMNQTDDITDNFAAAIPNLGLFYSSDQSSIIDPLSENSSFPSNNNANFGFTSVLSTPSSSPTQLTASCSTEDERDSYCSNLLNFDIPSTMLDVNDYM